MRMGLMGLVGIMDGHENGIGFAAKMGKPLANPMNYPIQSSTDDESHPSRTHVSEWGCG